VWHVIAELGVCIGRDHFLAAANVNVGGINERFEEQDLRCEAPPAEKGRGIFGAVGAAAGGEVERDGSGARRHVAKGEHEVVVLIDVAGLPEIVDLEELTLNGKGGDIVDCVGNDACAGALVLSALGVEAVLDAKGRNIGADKIPDIFLEDLIGLAQAEAYACEERLVISLAELLEEALPHGVAALDLGAYLQPPEEIIEGGEIDELDGAVGVAGRIKHVPLCVLGHLLVDLEAEDEVAVVGGVLKDGVLVGACARLRCGHKELGDDALDLVWNIILGLGGDARGIGAIRVDHVEEPILQEFVLIGLVDEAVWRGKLALWRVGQGPHLVDEGIGPHKGPLQEITREWIHRSCSLSAQTVVVHARRGHI
jgi:hypothetical protein